MRINAYKVRKSRQEQREAVNHFGTRSETTPAPPPSPSPPWRESTCAPEHDDGTLIFEVLRKIKFTHSSGVKQYAGPVCTFAPANI